MQGASFPEEMGACGVRFPIFSGGDGCVSVVTQAIRALKGHRSLISDRRKPTGTRWNGLTPDANPAHGRDAEAKGDAGEASRVAQQIDKGPASGR